jgi:hypothetical protein
MEKQKETRCRNPISVPLCIAVLFKPCICTCARGNGYLYGETNRITVSYSSWFRCCTRLLINAVLLNRCTCTCARQNGYLYGETKGNTVPYSSWCGRCTRLIIIALLFKPCTCTCAKEDEYLSRKQTKTRSRNPLGTDAVLVFPTPLYSSILAPVPALEKTDIFIEKQRETRSRTPLDADALLVYSS